MKKFTVSFLAGLLILAFGTAAFAQAPKLEFRASGMLDTQTFYGVNVPQYGGQMNNPQTNASFWGSNTTALFLNTAYGGLPNYYSLGNFPPPGSPIGTSWTGAGYVLPAGLAGGVATGSMGYPNLYGQSNPNFALALGAPAQVVDRIGNAGAGRATWAPNFTPAAPFGRTDSTASVSNGFDKVNSH